MVYDMKDTLLAAIANGYEVVCFDCRHNQWMDFTPETVLSDCSAIYIKPTPTQVSMTNDDDSQATQTSEPTNSTCPPPLRKFSINDW